MAGAIDWIAFFYPYLLDEADPRHVPLADIDTALAVAADYRPDCLPVAQQDQAQAHYVAYLLDFRAQHTQSTSGSTSGGTGSSFSTTTTTASGAVTEKQEGDVRVKFADNSSKSNTSAASTSARNANSGPSVSYAAWLGLWAVCNPTDIAVVGPPDTSNVPVTRRGGLITRAGWPD